MGPTLSIVADTLLQVNGRERGPGGAAVFTPSFFSSRVASGTPPPPPPSPLHPPQRPWLRHVPPLDACTGPVEGLTCIVTGPTR